MALHGEWRLRSDDAPALRGTALRREVPLPGTPRTRTTKKLQQEKQKRQEDGQDQDDATADGSDEQMATTDDLDIRAFPAVVGESVAMRRRRLRAYRQCWRSIQTNAEAILTKSNSELFSDVWAYVSDEHQKATATDSPCHHLTVSQVPMGLIFAGGISSADHSQTFADLATSLKDQGAHVASLRPSTVMMGSGPGPVLERILQQLANLEGSCGSDTDALCAWRRESLRDSPEGAARPLVVILEEAESLDPAGLSDLLILLSDARQELPVVLRVEAYSRMRFSVFQLPSALARLELIVKDVLLSGKHSIMFHRRVCMAIDDYFQRHDFTTFSLLRSLQLALLSHFVHEPLALLLPSISSDKQKLLAAVSEVAVKSPQLLAYGRVEICPEVPRDAPDALVSQGIAAAIGTAQVANIAWTVVLRWIVAAAQLLSTLDPQAFKGGFSMKDLFRVGSFTSYFAAGGQGQRSVQKMATLIGTLSPAQVRELLQAWVEAVNEVQDGHSAVGELYQDMQRLLAGDMGDTVAAGGEATTSGTVPDQSIQEATHPEPVVAKPAAKKPRRAPGRSRAALQQAVDEITKAAAAKALAASPQTALARKAAAVLQTAVERHLCRSPQLLPGSRVLLCQGQGVEQMLMAAPRSAVHSALATPSEHIQSILQDSSSTVTIQHNTASVYALSLQEGEYINLADWYVAFEQQASCASAAGTRAGEEISGTGQEAETAPTPAATRRARGRGRAKGRGRGRKRAGKDQAPAEPPAATAAAAAAADATPGVELRDADRLQMAARFTQATSELQLFGYIKPTRRNRIEAAQRLIFPYTAE